jgi:hypothetical protein
MFYLITVYPQDFIEYVIEADNTDEAWDKYHANEYVSKEEDFTGRDWQSPKIAELEQSI